MEATGVTVAFTAGGGAPGDDGVQTAALPPGVETREALVDFICRAFKQPPQDLVISDGERDIGGDDAVRALRPGQRVLARPRHGADQPPVFKERISFNPHPKTLTMAGDYEYFAAQGHHPLAFALAELVDNALRATKANGAAGEGGGRGRRIEVSLVTDERGGRGMVAVSDNGCGMSTAELGAWAVMNLSLEDRGLLAPGGAAAADEGKAASRYLSSDISYFGVGSKNAAFYLGRTVKVATRTTGSAYVHELCIQAAELERRYREGQAVYEDDMVHRQPGDESSLAPWEREFPTAAELLRGEAAPPAAGASPPEPHPSGRSFTRVLVYDLKAEVLGQLAGEDEGESVVRDLAHLYHYYLHGARGNSFTKAHASRLPNGEAVPDIVVGRLRGRRLAWRRCLSEVADDLESRYLAARRSELEFALSVPNHGRVEGVLWYFPFENDRETVPLDPHTMNRMLMSSSRGGSGAGAEGALASCAPPTQAAGPPGHHGGAPTQAGVSQAHAWQSQAARRQADADSEQEAGYAALLAACPTFEAFWQGRLIPGACVDSLPFIRSVRAKRSAAAKDKLPDEVFSRVRGALFFGPGFRVTRNKLTFRDNLALLLEAATPVERQLEKHFRDWLAECHRTLDRSVRFEALCPQSVQLEARKELGRECTVFERVHDGVQHIGKGDVVRLNTKPAIVGRVLHFSIPQVVQAEGCYSGGRVTVCALPTELLGAHNRHTWPLRRLDGLVAEEELSEHVARELAKLPSALCFEPMRLAASGVVTLPAGSSLCESSIGVVNGHGAKVVKALIGGARQQLRVMQSLYYLGPAGTARKRSAAAAGQSGAPAASAAGAAEVSAAAGQDGSGGGGGKKAGKRSKRRRKGAGEDGGAADKENEQPAADGGSGGDDKRAAAAAAAEAALAGEEEPVPEGELLLSVENKSPIQDTFQFQRITGGLTRAGCYCLQYSLQPELPGGRTLRLSIDLQVTAGPPITFDIRGEGRAVALSKSLLLGEALPPLRLLLQDAHGNAVPGGAEWADKVPQLQVLASSVGGGGGGPVLQELHVSAEAEAQEGEICLSNLRVLGPPSPAAGGAGMQLFRPPAPPGSAPSSRAATQHCGAAGPAATASLHIVRAVDVYLSACIEGLPPQGFPLRLAPGAPQSLRLLRGHPFCAAAAGTQPPPLLTQLVAPEQALAPACVMSGEELPAFKVQAVDVWGNPTCPSDELPFEVELSCQAADPVAASFPVDGRGVAIVSGVSLYRQDPPSPPEGASQPPPPPSAEDQQHQLLLRPSCPDVECPLLQQALQLARPQDELELPLLVQPSTRPANLLMLYQGEELARRTADSGEGPELVWQLSGVEAGSRIEGLAVRCVDEVSRPAASGVRGRIQVSWAKGSKKAVLGAEDIRLPSMAAPDTVGAATPFWVRFTADPKDHPGVSLDIQFEVTAAPGPPVSWSVAIVDYSRGAAAAAAAGGRSAPASAGADLATIPCGEPFYLEIEALDACHNRCSFADAGSRPTPVVLAEPEDAEAQLQLRPDTWQHKWDNTQAGGDVCLFKLWLAGPPGPVRLVIRDEAGEDGASLLQPDELPVELLAGPPAALVADCPAQLECGTRGLLDVLPVKAVDAYGNLAAAAALEVALNGSAFNDEGTAARVAAAGSNRAKLRGGVATFKGVRITAVAEGVYKLTVGCVSRKVALTEAAVTVRVAQQNYVCGLELLAASLPAEGSRVGGRLRLLAALQTEDGAPLPWDTLAELGGLSVALEPPRPADAAAEAAGGGAAPGRKGGGKGGGKGAAAAARAEPLTLVPERLVSAGEDGLEPEAAAAAAESAPRGCVVLFTSPELTAAGQYTATATYRELRPELLPGLSKQEQLLRSTSLQFSLAAGPVAGAALQAGGADQEVLTISNGSEPAHRRLLRNAAVQLQDAHGNAASAAGVAVRVRLLCADGAGGSQAEAPLLCCSGGELQVASDERGRAFLGDVAVEQGTGRMGAAGQALQCALEVQVLLPRSKGRRGSGAPSAAWATVWSRDVTFTDDAAHIRELQALHERREELAQQLASASEGVAGLRQRLDAAQAEHKAACRGAKQQMAALRDRLRQPDLAMPESSAGARQLVRQLRDEAAKQPERPALAARYGGPRQAATAAIGKLLSLGDPDMVGVFAQLGFVDEPRLSAVMTANYCAAMSVVVVKSYEAIDRLRALAKHQGLQVPSMLAYSLIQEYTSETHCGGGVKMRGVSELAHELTRAACQGTDDPLPIPLPHTRQLFFAASRQAGVRPPPGGPVADEWPAGCLGYAVNLVRPAISNTRKGLLYAQLGRTLVFEALGQAAAYRQFCVQSLKTSAGDIVTLDGNKLSGRGVVVGSHFRAVPVEEAAFRFGTCPAAAQATQASLTQREAAAEAVVEALQQQEDAAAELEAVEMEAAQPEHRAAEQQAEELEQQLRQLDERIRQKQGSAEGGRGGRGSSRRMAQQEQDEAAQLGGGGGSAAERPVGGEGRQQRAKRQRA